MRKTLLLLMNDHLEYYTNQTNCAMVFITHFRNEIPESFTSELNLKAGEIK